MKKFLRRRLFRDKNHGFFERIFSRKKSIAFVIGFGIVLFVVIFLIRIFFGEAGSFTRRVSTFWNFSAVILLQNDAEIRPTGGFLSGFFLLEIRNGIPHFSFLDSYAIAPSPEPISAPVAITDIFSADPKFSGFVARDANFSPDFPESAATFLSFLQFDPRFSEKHFDAVFAVNFSAIERIADAFLDKPSARDLFLRIQRDSKNIDLHSIEDLSSRKDSAGDILDELRGAVGILGIPKLLSIAAAEADKRTIQLAFFDPHLARISAEKNWDGALPQDEFWGVNLANLGAKKSDRFTRQHFSSDIFWDSSGKTIENFTISLENFGGENILSGPGSYFVRIFRPVGTTFFGEIPAGFSQKNSSSFTEFSTTISVKPGQKSQFSVRFLLPHFPSTLTWHGQSGVSATLSLSISGSGETRFFADDCRSGLTLLCERILSPDTTISIEKVSDTFSPFLENAAFTNAREIFLRFSEPILPETSPKNLTVVCDDVVFPLEKIAFSEAEPRDATLLLRQSVPSEQGFCEMRWSGISDLLGNIGSGKMTIPR